MEERGFGLMSLLRWVVDGARINEGTRESRHVGQSRGVEFAVAGDGDEGWDEGATDVSTKLVQFWIRHTSRWAEEAVRTVGRRIEQWRAGGEAVGDAGAGTAGVELGRCEAHDGLFQCTIPL